MRSLDRRLAKVKGQLGLRDDDGPQGAIETHYTEAWSEGNADSAPASLEACSEHGPTCGVSIIPIHSRIRRIVVLSGPYVELG